MKQNTEPGTPPEARIAELEKHVTRLRIGLILVASVIIWQGTQEMGWLGPVRVYATEVYATQFVLEDETQKVYGRWEAAGEEAPARLMVFGDGPDYVRISAEGLERRADRALPAETGIVPLAP